VSNPPREIEALGGMRAKARFRSNKDVKRCAGPASMLVVAFLPFGGTAAENSDTCVTAAFNDYNAANLALITKIPMPVETTIAQRRLQEQYCLRAAHCELPSMASQEGTVLLDVEFSKCLEEEAKEKYDLVPRTEE